MLAGSLLREDGTLHDAALTRALAAKAGHEHWLGWFALSGNRPTNVSSAEAHTHNLLYERFRAQFHDHEHEERPLLFAIMTTEDSLSDSGAMKTFDHQFFYRCVPLCSADC